MNVVSNEFDFANRLPLFDIRGDVYRCTATGEIRTSQGKVARAEDHDALSGDVVESDVVSSHDDRAAHTHISNDAAVARDGQRGCECGVL
jgi:hypothetical protein